MNKQFWNASIRRFVLALIVVLGAGLGLTQAQTTSPVRAVDFIVALVNSEPLTNAQVQATRARLVRDLQNRNQALPSAAELTEQAFQLLMDETVQLQQAQELGIKVSADEVAQAEAGMAANNQMSLTLFRARMAQSGLSAQALKEQIQNQMVLSRLREREVQARLRITDTDIQQFLREWRQQETVTELNLAMILLALPDQPDTSTLEKQASLAQEVAQRARRGEDFASLAKAHSQAMDRGLRGGEMGLRPVDRYPELFVQAVADVPVGGVAGPVRSGAGFHVLKVLERKDSASNPVSTQTRARHILLRTGPNLSGEQAIAQLQTLRQQITSGQIGFAQAARQRSQDGSAEQGGDLGWVGAGQFVPEFEQVMNRLQPGDISQPVVSRFGVHLIEVIERRQVPLSEREQRDLARSALREQRLEETYERWLSELRANAYIERREPPEVRPLVVR